MDSREKDQIEAAQEDPARFGALYEEHFERIYAFIVRRVRDRSVAEDLTAEVFRHALASIRNFEWRGIPFSAWLYRIAANEIADYVKKKGREQETMRTDEPGKDEIHAVEQRASLFRLVGGLPADQQRVIVLRFAEERSIREIAADLGRSEGAIKQLQWRALQTLRTQMGQSHG